MNCDAKAFDTEDSFSNSSENVRDFDKSLEIPQGKDNFDSLLYSIFYYIRYQKTKQKNDKNRNEELKSVLLNDLFASLDKNQLN